MNIQQNISLRKYNTFGIDVRARYFTSVSDTAELLKIIEDPGYPDRFILGGGSNILLTRDLEILVIHMKIKGITVLQEDENQVLIRAGAGENWHDFVLWTLDRNYGGLENLSLIPGNVGTAPIQNIGAYGVELKDVFESCEAVEVRSGKRKTFTGQDCRFGYRDSIFKQEAKGKYIITNVTFRLSKNDHDLHTGYGAIKDLLEERGIAIPSIQDVSDAVIAIRKSKLPDPAEIGNSGSFFKNPVITVADYEKLKTIYPEIPGYNISENQTKVPAGWLIEQCGFKGKRYGDAGVHAKQALVLVNYGNASGIEIWQLAQMILAAVKDKFGISLEPEVNVL
ncbi:UDP-N-acetylmuramate dehydrogenase [Sinomicrobium sp. M5D2P17]